MRKSKFTDSQIMDAVKRVEAGFAVPVFAVSWGSVRQRFKSGVPNTAAWMCR